MDRLQSVEIVSAAAGRVECDILLKNASVVDVFTCTIFNASIGIYKGRFVGFGEYCAKQVIDCSGKYVCPSLLDAHSHVESSLVGPREYASAALPHGITGIAADPHEIANVAGVKGIEWMIEQSKGVPFDFLWMLPSCVPATPMETSGAKLTAVDLKPLLSCDSVYGLAEVMDFISMRSADSDILAKIDNARDAGKKVDGHCSGLAQYDLNIYASVGVNSDHESATAEEVLQRVRRGMYAFLRDGGAAKNLLSFISAIKLNNGRHMCLCSDDKHIDELVSEGTIDHAVRLLIDNGIRAEVAICMASLNTAQRFGLDNKGAIAVGYSADFLILDDLNKFVINSVYKDGVKRVEDGKLISKIEGNSYALKLGNTVNIPTLDDKSFQMKCDGKLLNVIGVEKGQISTKHLQFDNEYNGGLFVSDKAKDLVKIAVIERYGVNGKIGLGIINGLKIEGGALGTTVAHDSHQMILCGDNDQDMLVASQCLAEIGGGLVVVKDKKVAAKIQLDIGGVMSSLDYMQVLSMWHKVANTVGEVAKCDFEPFLPLAFMGLTVIPELKLTTSGLFDVVGNKWLNYCE